MNLMNPSRQQRTLKQTLQLGLAAVLCLLLFSVPGHCSISIMPMEAKLQVERPGARLTNDIEVYNISDVPIHVNTSVMDWTMSLSGQKQFYGAGTQPLSCAKWIQVNPVEFSLPAGKSMRVRYSATTPDNMTQEHWAMIFFTARAVPKEGDSRFAVNIQTRMGCKVLIAPALKAPLQGKITGMELQTGDASAGQAAMSKVKVTVINPNAVSVRLSGTVEAHGADGALAARGVIMPAKALVLVGATRELWAQFDKPLPPGAYQIKVAIDYGSKELVGGSLKATVKEAATVSAQATPSAAASE